MNDSPLLNREEFQYDLFISHASEDKIDFVRPLVKRLKQAGIRVWYDEDIMNIGDSLRSSIDKGLKTSRFAIVVLSNDYFLKKWTNFELNGFFSFNNPDMRKILPIWHNVSADDIREYSAMLADTVAIQSSMEMPVIVERIVRSLNIQPSVEVREFIPDEEESYNNGAELLKVYLNNENIHGIFRNGQQRQLTFEGADSNPLLVKSKSTVVFLRSVKRRSSWSKKREYRAYKLMAMDAVTLEERVLTDQKPFRDGQDGSFELLQVFDLTVSPDDSKALFLTGHSATSHALVQVDIMTGEFDFLFSAERFDLIEEGQFKGKFLIGEREYRDTGTGIYYKICDFSGTTLHDFNDYDAYIRFRSKGYLLRH